MNFLREAMSDGIQGTASAKRMALILGAFSLAVAVVILSIAASFGQEVTGVFSAACAAIATLSGTAYVGGKAVEK